MAGTAHVTAPAFTSGETPGCERSNNKSRPDDLFLHEVTMLNGNNNNTPKVEGQLRVALLGAGKVAEAHARALKSIPGVSVVAICDMDGKKAETFAERWNIPARFDDPAR